MTNQSGQAVQASQKSATEPLVIEPPDIASQLSPSAWTHLNSRVFVIVGTVAVVGGALLSAAIAPTPSYHGSWAVAYIVLVVGVAQVVLGVAQTSVTGGSVPGVTIAAQAACFNVGAAATVVATLLNLAPVLYVGALLQIVALVLFLVATRHGRGGATLIALRIITVLLVLSVPVGVILQAITH